MTLWWAKRNQLDDDQVKLIEKLGLNKNHLVLGPPGSGKTNVLLRRAQFARSQGQVNTLVITFTRALTEFVRTGCYDINGNEIFPASCVTTLEKWIRDLYKQHGEKLPDDDGDYVERKREIARGAIKLRSLEHMPKYDTLFIDEAQDFLPEEIDLMVAWSHAVFLVGDDRQRIYNHSKGLDTVRKCVPSLDEHKLPFHYRLAAEICRMADRILTPISGESLAATCHYNGPKPATISFNGPLTEQRQLEAMCEKLRDQVRAYSSLIQLGDRLGIVVAKKARRDEVLEYLENKGGLKGKAQIIRARTGEEDDSDYQPSFSPDHPICILTINSCKGLEFRALHWIFAEELNNRHTNEHYYTVVTRAKTSLDLYYSTNLSQTLAKAHAPVKSDLW